MILVCNNCDTPILVPASDIWLRIGQLQLECSRCGSVYLINVQQIRQPTPAKREKITQERKSRIIDYNCAKCGTRLGIDLTCPVCPKPKELSDAT